MKLPTFRTPPVTEVALAIQFEANSIDALVAALYRERIRDSLPRIEEQPARPPMAERFDAPAAKPSFELELLPAPAMPRFWFLSEDGSELVQLQHDLVAVNWRWTPDTATEYPRYPVLRRRMETHLAGIAETLREQGSTGLTRPNWCEVTYINTIGPGTESDARPPLDTVLSHFRPPAEGTALPQLEDGQVTLRYRIPGDSGPRGRLTIFVGAGVRIADQVPIWEMRLTARVQPIASSGITGALEALDAGRELVVSAFLESTTSSMHTIWGLIEGEDGSE